MAALPVGLEHGLRHVGSGNRGCIRHSIFGLLAVLGLAVLTSRCLNTGKRFAAGNLGRCCANARQGDGLQNMLRRGTRSRGVQGRVGIG